MDVLNGFHIGADFFETNPQLEIMFGEVKKKFKKKASKLMWSIALAIHPDSKYTNMSLEAKKKLINEEYFSDIDWEDEFTLDVIERFKSICLTKPQLFLVQWESKLEERQHFIDKLEYNEQTYELLDKMMKATDSMWKQYMTCRKDVEEEKAQTMGGAQESLVEMGII